GFNITADSGLSMATEPKAATDDVKIDLFEDDDEFEEILCKMNGTLTIAIKNVVTLLLA
ncbi:unnamed protein product, partial [Sphenostylis stenocarpa]